MRSSQDETFLLTCIQNKATAHGRRHDFVLYLNHRVKKKDLLKLVNHSRAEKGLGQIRSATTAYNRTRPKNVRSVQARQHQGLGLFCCKSLLRQKTILMSSPIISGHLEKMLFISSVDHKTLRHGNLIF